VADRRNAERICRRGHATGKQIGVFYGRAPDSAGHTGIMTMDEARQMALDFAGLPERLKRNENAG
jgi:hypothetical protein